MNSARRPPLWSTALALSVAACSSAAPLPGTVQECTVDSDCDDEELCLVDQGNICVAVSIPARRPVLGLDVVEDDFRIEFRGCDAEIDPIDGLLRTDKRESLSTINLIDAINERPTIDCGACGQGECIDGTLCRSDFEGSFVLNQASRFGRSGIKSILAPYPQTDDEGLPLEGPIEFEWPRYIIGDENSDAPVVLELTPADPNLARVRRELARAADPATRDFTVTTRLDCQRKVSANLRTVGKSSPLADVTVSMYFNEEVASLATTIGAPIDELPLCTQSSDCSTGHACNDAAGRCVLSLLGSKASRDASSNESGDVLVPVYNYCEQGIVSSREFNVEVRPPEGSGLPVMNYDITQSFAIPSFDSAIIDPMPADLCLPDWAAPQTRTLSYSGNPVKLLETELGDFVCCTAECLPTALEEKMPSSASECSDIALSIEIATQLLSIDEDAWALDGCQLPRSGDAGRFIASGECSGSQCELALSSGEVSPEAEPLSYRAKLISPVGSVFASQSFPLTVVDGVAQLPSVELSPRVVLQGAVACTPSIEQSLEGGCMLEDVSIVAERLSQDDDDDPAPPYYFDTATVSDGTFTLLLDPGVYVMTAIPERGRPFAASDYRVVDLRNGAAGSLVEMSGGVPRADISNDPFVLRAGVPVVLRLRDFALGGRVEPFDLGSWASQATPLLDPSGEAIDLNEPQTCYSGGAADRGCQIRRMLRPGATGILASISNSTDFTMREAGPIECPAGE